MVGEKVGGKTTKIYPLAMNSRQKFHFLRQLKMLQEQKTLFSRKASMFIQIIPPLLVAGRQHCCWLTGCKCGGMILKLTRG